MFKKILVPIDISQADSGETGLKAAKEMAGKMGAALILLNVTGDVPNLVADRLPANFAKETQERAVKALEELAGKHGLKSSDYEVQAIHGQTYDKIIEVAGKTGADLIVISSHRPGMADYLLGSTAAKVVRHAQCSVLVVRN